MTRPDWLVTDIGIVAIDKSVGGGLNREEQGRIEKRRASCGMTGHENHPKL